MNKPKKKILIGSFLLIILLCIGINVNKVLSDTKAELQSISTSGSIIIWDDSPMSALWIPNNQESTLSELTTWLNNSNPYSGKIPKSSSTGVSAANIFPSRLCINTSNNHQIIIVPAIYFKMDQVKYITDVLQLSNDGNITYIKSKELYDWLINDKWQEEFKKDDYN